MTSQISIRRFIKAEVLGLKWGLPLLLTLKNLVPTEDSFKTLLEGKEHWFWLGNLAAAITSPSQCTLQYQRYYLGVSDILGQMSSVLGRQASTRAKASCGFCPFQFSHLGQSKKKEGGGGWERKEEALVLVGMPGTELSTLPKLIFSLPDNQS